MGEKGAVVRPLRDGDCRRVAEIDVAARAGAVLPALGIPFLVTLYRALLKSGLAAGSVYEEANEIIGFVFGCLDTPRALRRVVMRAFLPLRLKAGFRCLTGPALIPRLIETSRYPHRAKASVPELLVISSVDAANQGRRVREALVKQLNEAFCARGFKRYKVTVKQNLEGANHFDRRLQFRLVGQFEFYGEPWNIYEYLLSVDRAS